MDIGLDIGFGDVKAAYKNGSGYKTLKYPTAIQYASTMSKECLNNFRAGEYEYKGRKYLVGEDAKKGAFSTQHFEFLKKFAPLFAFIMIDQVEKATGYRVERLGLGLPLTYYTRKNISEIQPNMEIIAVNGITREIPVSFFVQGYGVLVDYTSNFPPADWGTVIKDLLVVDVGFNTVDIINVVNGKVARKGSDTLDREGVSKMTQELMVSIKEKNIKLSPVEAVELLKTGILKQFGELVDCTAEVQDVTGRYADWLFSELESIYIERMMSADKIILAGGGACFLKHYLPAKYASIVHIPEDPEMANARGFLRLMEQKA